MGKRATPWSRCVRARVHVDMCRTSNEAIFVRADVSKVADLEVSAADLSLSLFCLSCLSVCLSVCLSACLCLPCLSLCLCVCLSLFVLSLFPFVSLSVLSLCLSVCVSLCRQCSVGVFTVRHRCVGLLHVNSVRVHVRASQGPG